MKENTCKVCSHRKGKRNCPGHGGMICSSCCGKERERGFACPQGCSFLNVGEAFMAVRDQDRRLNLIRDKLRDLAGKERPMEKTLLRIEQSIFRVFRNWTKLTDRETATVLENLIAGLEPGSPLFKSVAGPGSPAQAALNNELRRKLGLCGDSSGSPARDLIPALKRVLLSVVDHHDSRRPQAYLEFVAPLTPLSVGDSEPSNDLGEDDVDVEVEVSDKVELREHFEEMPEMGDGSEVRLHHETYEISFESPIPGTPDLFPEPVRHRPEIIVQIKTDPERTRAEVEEWLREFPENPVLTHFMVQIAFVQDNPAEAEKWARENYERNPDYLFAKLDWAQILISSNRTDEVPEVFGKKFLLTGIYPNRKIFHITEHIGFCSVMARYFCTLQKPASAKVYLDMIKDVDPENPLVTEERMTGLNFLTRIKSAFRRLIGSDPGARTGTDDD